jgi:2-dehydropantoate 2-reductase
MKIAVMGSGAVGCYYGAMLAQVGHKVMLIGRPQHVDAMHRHGLILERHSTATHVPVQAATEAEAVRDAELVLFCVKSTDTKNAGQTMAPHLAQDTTILSLQNGVDNAERLQLQLERPVIPTVVYVAAEMAGPGHVRHHGRGELILGPSPGSAALATLFTEAGIPTEVSDNAIGALWAKMILNCGYNALSAIAQQPYGPLAEAEDVRVVIKDVVQECLAVAEKMEVCIPGDTWRAVAQIVETMPTQYSSTAQDLARGKASEIDYLNGYILRKGQELGVATPVNRVLYVLVKLLEGRSPVP